jgi:hypothetical protein
MHMKWMFLVMVAMMTTGCAESVTLIGNGASMVVAVALLWSTVNLKRDTSGEEQ